MMNCAFHSVNVAVVSCNGCGKPLCPACDHRIKGFPFCQDCIVNGIQLLRDQRRVGGSNFVNHKSSPFVATFLSMLCPGLGAAYNGQSAKALVYFGIFVGLFQLAITSRGMPIFVFGFFAMWLFSAIDSWRSAKLIRAGITTANSEDLLIQKLSGNPRVWGFALGGLGALVILQQFFSMRPFMRSVLPVALMVLGGYFLWRYVPSFGRRRTIGTSSTFGEAALATNRNETSFRAGEFAHRGNSERFYGETERR